MAPARDAQLEAYDRATAALLGLIRGERSATRSFAGQRRRAEAKLARTRALLAALGNPQARFPIVHVTGTSGKGSTATMVATILGAAGYRVGLRTSPYVQVATEKLQVGGELIPGASLDRLTSRVLATGQHIFPGRASDQRLGYAEAWTALAMLWFAERAVDIAVVEVGSGGRFDATNVVDSAVSVITSVGLDHVRSLGPTVADIAWHKAGIIKPGSSVVVGDLPIAAWAVVQEEARAAGARLIRSAETGLPPNSHPGMHGGFQLRNAGVAATVVERLRNLGFIVPPAAVAAGIAAARLPARLELMPHQVNPAVWVDGAHNADKIAALATEIGRGAVQKPGPVIVLGVIDAKDARSIVAGLLPVASAIVCTEPTVLGKRSTPATELRRAIAAAGFAGELTAERAPALAVVRAERIARSIGTHVLVTGSLYLAGQVRGRWFPDDQIVLQQTPWPGRLSGVD